MTRKHKLCLVSSSGGHWEQLKKLAPLAEKYDGFYVTEKTRFDASPAKYLMYQTDLKDKTQEYKLFWPELNTDGHCSYSPDGKWIITDTYPNRKRLASVFMCREDGFCKRIARVFAPFRYDFDCRCDLHPRWSRDGSKVCIDSVHEGKRGLYIIPIKFN